MNDFKFNTAKGIISAKAKLINKRQSIFTKLCVDTGASFTMVSSETALTIGIDPSRSKRHIEITTAGGIVFVPIVNIPSFICFGIEVKNLPVVCHNLPPETTVEGLLGLNFLTQAKVTIDFSQNFIHCPK